VRIHAGRGSSRTVVLTRTFEDATATVVLHFGDTVVDPEVLDLPDEPPLLGSADAPAIAPWSARLYVVSCREQPSGVSLIGT
jgi:hypothetical protein